MDCWCERSVEDFVVHQFREAFSLAFEAFMFWCAGLGIRCGVWKLIGASYIPLTH
jgi:hypothetical protein